MRIQGPTVAEILASHESGTGSPVRTAARVADAYARVAAADALLVVGTSLKVFSGFRFVRAAAERGTPVAILNRGVTRGDALAAVKADGPCGPVLHALALRLAPA